jgi:hypothetical protein
MPWKRSTKRSLPLSSLVADIHARWNQLRAGAQADAHTFPVSVLPIDTGFGPASLGIDAEGRAQLLLPVASGVLRPRIEGLTVIQIGATTLRDGGASRSYLIVTCLNRNLDRAFADLAEAVLTRIAAGEPAAVALVAAITELRSLFAAPDKGAVDDNLLRGLVAELIVLQRLSARHPAAPDLWFGPIPERHDFRGGEHAIEVKSTARPSGTMTISSAHQLDAPTGGTLQLWRVALERTQGGRATVGGLVTAIEALCGPSERLRQGLANLGCIDPGSEPWNRLSFNCEGIDGWQVTTGFPRIVPSMFGPGGLPSGILKLTYELDLSAASDFSASEAEMEAMEQLLVSHL